MERNRRSFPIGEGNRRTSTNDQRPHTLRLHVAAITRMLLGKNVKLAPGVAITGGDVLSGEGIANLVNAAIGSDTDVIHLAVQERSGGLALADIDVVVPRDQRCYAFTGCRLWLAAGARQALLLPRDGARGHFRLLPGELLHIDGKPQGVVSDGLRHAERQLAALVRSADVGSNGVSFAMSRTPKRGTAGSSACDSKASQFPKLPSRLQQKRLIKPLPSASRSRAIGG